MSVTDDLLDVHEVSNWLSTTEAMTSTTLVMDGTVPAVASLPVAWNVGLKDKEDLDQTDAVLNLNGTDYTLTKEAVLSITHAVGLPASYVAKTPGVMIQAHLNYWLTHSPDISLKLLTKGNQILAVCKEGIKPFSNQELLDRALDTLAQYTEDDNGVWADPKTRHDLHMTSLRLVLPDENVQITRAEGSEEMWSAGLQIQNSLTGHKPLSIQGYLFCWEDGRSIVTQHSMGRYNRKTMGQEMSEVLDWVGQTTEDILGNVEHDFEVLNSTVEESFADSVDKVLADTFRTYKVPLKTRQPIMDALLEEKDYTYYGLIEAVTKQANSSELPEHFVTALLEIGGDLAASAHDRCNACKRVLI